MTLAGRASELRLNLTEAEQHLWNKLRAKRLDGLKFRRQVVVGSYIVDFLCHEAKLVVEVDDSEHADNAHYDARRTEEIERLGFRVMRVWNNDVHRRMDSVLAAILSAARG